jgi:hypothetical protein
MGLKFYSEDSQMLGKFPFRLVSHSYDGRKTSESQHAIHDLERLQSDLTGWKYGSDIQYCAMETSKVPRLLVHMIY